MNTKISNTTRNENLSGIERVLRVAVGSVLLGSVMTSAPGLLGWTSVLALVAIYPMLTGLMGFDPLRSVVEGHRTAYRVVQAVLTVALISTVYIIPTGSLGLITLLPLFSIYSALGVVLGRSPLAMLTDANQSIPYVVTPATQTMGMTPTAGAVSRRAA